MNLTANSTQIISPILKQKILEQGIDKTHFKILSDSKFIRLKEKITAKHIEFESKRYTFFHKLNPHVVEVAERSAELIKLSKENNIEMYSQLAEIAALLHDIDYSFFNKQLYHCIRPEEIYVDETGLRRAYTNEEWSSFLADYIIEEFEFSSYQRLLIQGIIISTTFNHPDIKPQNKLEEIVTIADIGGFTKSMEEWLLECYKVFAELPKDTIPQNIEHWLKDRKAFLKYIEGRMCDESWESWGEEHAYKVEIIDHMTVDPFHPDRKVMHSFLEKLLN